MSEKLEIMRGTRMKVAFERELGLEPVFNMICTFFKQLDESVFLVSVPMVDGKFVSVTSTQRMLFRIQTDDNGLIVAGYVNEVVQEGIRSYWKVQRVEAMRQFYKRKDERYRVALELKFITEYNIFGFGDRKIEEATSSDISYGGLAMYSNRRFIVGDVCHIALPPLNGITSSLNAPELVSVVCWQREAPSGYKYGFLCGMQFRFSDDSERDAVVEYVDYIKKLYAL